MPNRPNGSAALRTLDDCVLVSTVTRERPRDRIHSAPSTRMTAASSPSRSSAAPACPSEASWMACAASPGGSQRSHRSIPSNARVVILPSAASLGTTWANVSYKAKIGMIRNAAKSLPRRDRSIPARPVVTNRASTMQNSTWSSTATTATSRPSGPRASPTVTPSRPITLASGQAPVAEAASRPTASGRVRSGYSASVAGSSVPSRPNTSSGRISQPNANTVNTAAVWVTGAADPRSRASTMNVPNATSTAKTVLMMNEILAGRDARSALVSSCSFSWTRSRAMSVPPPRWPANRPGR